MWRANTECSGSCAIQWRAKLSTLESVQYSGGLTSVKWRVNCYEWNSEMPCNPLAFDQSVFMRSTGHHDNGPKKSKILGNFCFI